MKKYLIFLFPFFLFSCNKGGEDLPKGILSKPEMAAVMVDIHLIEGGIMAKNFKNDEGVEEIRQCYLTLFKARHLDRQGFERSLKYYSEHLELLEEVYGDVMNQLSKKLAEAESQVSSPKP